MLRSLKNALSRGLILFCLAGVLLVAMTPMSASAEYSRIGLFARHVIAASPNNIYTYAGAAGQSSNDMPKAFLMWSASQSKFYARRNTTSLTTFESYYAQCPAGKEIVITPLSIIRAADIPFCTIEMSGTVGDTIYVGPMW